MTTELVVFIEAFAVPQIRKVFTSAFPKPCSKPKGCEALQSTPRWLEPHAAVADLPNDHVGISSLTRHGSLPRQTGTIRDHQERFPTIGGSFVGVPITRIIV